MAIASLPPPIPAHIRLFDPRLAEVGVLVGSLVLNSESVAVREAALDVLQRGKWGFGMEGVERLLCETEWGWDLLKGEIEGLGREWEGMKEAVVEGVRRGRGGGGEGGEGGDVVEVREGEVIADEVVGVVLDAAVRGEWVDVGKMGKILVRYGMGGEVGFRCRRGGKEIVERRWMWKGLKGRVLAGRRSLIWDVLGVEDLVKEIGGWLGGSGEEVNEMMMEAGRVGSEELLEVGCWWRGGDVRGVLWRGEVGKWTEKMGRMLVVGSRKWERGLEVAGYGVVRVTSDGNVGVMRGMVEEGVDLTQSNPFGKTALMIEVGNQHVDSVRFLLEAGSDVNQLAKDGSNALHMAVLTNNLECMRVLVDAGVDVHVANEEGYTPLLVAAKYAGLDSVELLLEVGCEVGVANVDGDSALGVASKRGAHDIVQCLIRAGADIHHRNLRGHAPLHLAVLSASVPTIQFLLECGADMDSRIDGYASPYDLATQRAGIREVLDSWKAAMF